MLEFYNTKYGKKQVIIDGWNHIVKICGCSNSICNSLPYGIFTKTD